MLTVIHGGDDHISGGVPHFHRARFTLNLRLEAGGDRRHS